MRGPNRGLTLIEVIISLGLISILTLSVTAITLAIYRSWQGESSFGNQRLLLSSASETMLREFRAALGINSAGPRQVNIWLDFNDNGLQDSGEQVTFSWSGVSAEGLYRSQGASLNQEILKNLDNFSVICLGQDNQPLNFPIIDTSLIRVLQIKFKSKLEGEVIDLPLSVQIRNL